MKKSIFSILLAIIALPLFAQAIDTEKLDAYFDALDKNNKFMGTVSVTQNGKTIYSNSIGFADVDSELKPNENSRYRIGSISKTFTAVMILQAMEQGKLNLDETLDNYFPIIKKADKITLRQMLYHRSGIHNFTADESYLTWNTKPKTQAQMLEIIKEGGSDFDPDSKMAYSNSTYVLLSYILEKVYNKPYADILKDNIVEPLHLTNTTIGNKIDIKKGDCNSYKYFDKWRIESETEPSITMGAGGISSTTNDINKFVEALFDEKLISEKSLVQMKTLKDNCGMGLFTIPFQSKMGFGHTGGIDGFSSIFMYFPDDKTTYSLTSNGSNYLNNNISIAVLSCVYGQPFETPNFDAIGVKTEDLDKYLGVYSCSQFPLKLSITKNGATLVAQGTGQPSFDLTATSENIFKFDQAGITLEFNSAESTMILKQGGGVFLMKRE